MRDYTPDWIHIYSGWRHFIPAAIGMVLVGLAGLLALLRRRFFPRLRSWMALLVLGFTILGTAYFTLRGFAHSFWSVHARDYIEKGVPQSDLHENIQNRSALVLPAICKVEASVIMGWRDYKRWFCIRGGGQLLQDQALKNGYAEDKGDSPLKEPIPEPIAKWLKNTKFQPDIVYTRMTGGSFEAVAIDSLRDQVVITSQDY